MPAPQSTSGAYGNLISGVSMAAATWLGAFLDLSGKVSGRLDYELQTGGTAPALPINFGAYAVKGTPTTITTFTNATTIVVANTAGMHVGQKIALQQAGSSKLGEIVTISAIASNTLTVSSMVNTYLAGDNVYLIGQTPAFPLAPQAAASGWAINTNYSAPVVLPTGRWFIGINNTSATSVTVSVSYDTTDSYA